MLEVEQSPVVSTVPMKLQYVLGNKWVLNVGILIAVLFTMLIIHFSFRFGRLATIPQYDDCAYLNDGARLATHVQKFGFDSIIPNYIAHPPHSPYSTFMAAAGYLLFGVEAWVPYLTNMVPVLVLIFFIFYLTKELASDVSLSLFIFALGAPIAGKMVFEFRPDIPCGLFTAIGVLLALVDPWFALTIKRRAMVGVLFGLAMLVKPTAFPFTLGIFSLTLLAAFTMEYLTSKPAKPFWNVAKEFGLTIMIFCVVVMPHYILNGRQIISYIILGMIHERSIWESHMSTTDHLRFAIDGFGGRLMLGKYAYFCLGVIVLGVGYLKFMKQKMQFWRLIAIIGILSAAYIVPAMNKVKTQYFAVTFDWLLILSCIWLFATALRNYGRSVCFAFCGSVVAFAIISFEWPEFYGERGNALFASRQQVYERIYNEVRARTRPGEVVFFTSHFIVNEHNLAWLFYRDGVQPPAIRTADKRGIMENQIAGIESASLVLVPEVGATDLFMNLPVTHMQEEVLAYVRKNPELVEASRIPTKSGRSLIVFAKAGPIANLLQIEGLGPEEGPYPQWNLGLVHWGFYPSTQLEIANVDTQNATLRMNCKADLPGQVMTIKLNGTSIYEFKFEQINHFYELSVPMNLSSENKRLEITYSKGSDDRSKPMAVLFKKLRVVPHRPVEH